MYIAEKTCYSCVQVVYTSINQVLICFRFVPDKGFSGADQAPSRDGPVQFEKDTEEDPFGLNKFLTEAKKAKRPVADRSALSAVQTFTCIHNVYVVYSISMYFILYMRNMCVCIYII